MGGNMEKYGRNYRGIDMLSHIIKGNPWGNARHCTALHCTTLHCTVKVNTEDGRCDLCHVDRCSETSENVCIAICGKDSGAKFSYKEHDWENTLGAF
jgi:hypothetical protein